MNHYIICVLIMLLVSSWHSTQAFLKGIHVVNSTKMKVEILPALHDNYMYLIVDEATKEAAVVDPVEPDLVMNAVMDHGVNLTKVLTTHHHWDHASGNKKIKEKVPGLKVFGGDDRIEGLTDKIKDGDTIKIGNLEVECLFTPCHTKGHICYLVKPDDEPQAVFTGDTLFIGGCGRFFEGNAEEMYAALLGKLGSLPEDTKVFCGHEYTVSNLKFAKKVDGNNIAVENKLIWAEGMRKEFKPTVPSTIGDEKKTNPFMRVHDKALETLAESTDAIKVMAFIRQQKDNFKG
uniref:hydroxyacylglutathione hydrolase n=1 Tax=Clastoptera arizonana TaxID=38151 RepID=A0A1B6D7X8_9HEMI